MHLLVTVLNVKNVKNVNTKGRAMTIAGENWTEYTKRDVAEFIEESHRTITYWTDFVGIIPDIQPSAGRGKARIYSTRNLVEFKMIQLMSRLNVKLETVRYIMQNLRMGYDIEQSRRAAIGKLGQ